MRTRVGVALTYQVEFKKPAKKFMDARSQSERDRIIKAIKGLPDQGDIKPVEGEEGNFRLRVGKYRIIYSVDEEKFEISILDGGSRGQIYKRH